MTKFLHKFKKPYSWLIYGQFFGQFFLKKTPGLSHIISYMPTFRKTAQFHKDF